MKRNLVWRLLRKNVSVGQIAGYAIANLVGLSIVLTAAMFYLDATTSTADDDPLFSRDYLVVSKHVSELGSLLGGSTAFTEQEIADLADQPWAANVGRFTSSRFNVAATVNFAGSQMGTYLFFESIPDRFFDVVPADWTFDPSDPSAAIPIVLSKDYLALYNYGFAASRGLPKISEKTVGRIPLRVSVSGNGAQRWFPARVVGFSSRLNTIAVPESFMQWANKVYGDPSQPEEVSRLIVETDDPGNPAIARYFDERGIEIGGDKDNSGKMAYFLAVMSAAVVTVGVVICLLAVFILTLSIFLLLQKNRDKIRDLILLGYTPAEAARPYYRLVVVVNAAILLLAVVATLIASRLWAAPFADLGLGSASPLPVILLGALLVLLITAFNLLAIRRLVSRLWRF